MIKGDTEILKPAGKSYFAVMRFLLHASAASFAFKCYCATLPVSNISPKVGLKEVCGREGEGVFPYMFVRLKRSNVLVLHTDALIPGL